mmetsp:Transcript_15267/g.32975  ORF Transcript_15267/g.32975 Transcript_15267/m.32975 type:complete len:367 (-) Transcript_15267:111-1211(-)
MFSRVARSLTSAAPALVCAGTVQHLRWQPSSERRLCATRPRGELWCEDNDKEKKKEKREKISLADSSGREEWFDYGVAETYDEAMMSPAVPWRRSWNPDWDGRHPPAEKKMKTQGKIKHILLIRHGQYDLEDAEHGLTELGREQARLTGQRLAQAAAGVKKDRYGEVKIVYSSLVSSCVLRAQQTAGIIAQELPDVYRPPDDPLLNEGHPVLPAPHGKRWIQEGEVLPSTLIEDGPRMEAGFRRYFKRDVDHKRIARREKREKENMEKAKEKGGPGEGFVPPFAQTEEAEASKSKEKEHEFIIVVCHMNAIRYFVARALQLPPEVWLRMRGNNCGITEIIIQPDGRVSLGSFADVGHLAIEQVTFH